MLCSSIFFIADSVFRGLVVNSGISIHHSKIVVCVSAHARNNDAVFVHTRRMQNTLALILRFPW